MKTILCSFTLCALAALAPLSLSADAAEWHHLHLNAPDPAEAAQWYADAFGGVAQKFGPLDVTLVGTDLIVFSRKQGEFPGSEGSSVDHVGFAVENADESYKTFEENGTKMLAKVRALGTLKFFFIEDPWGTKLEILQDEGASGLHHIHLHTPDPDATLAWYSEQFGGEITKFKGFLPAIQYGKVWLIAQQSEAKEPTEGRALDHLGWSFEDLDANAERMKANGVKFTLEPMNFQSLKISFVEGPDGVRIEVVQPAAE